MPQVIQRKRTKGWRMPSNTVNDTRPGIFGNPFHTAAAFRIWLETGVVTKGDLIKPVSEVDMGIKRGEIFRELPLTQGMDRACWCKDPATCHATVLLELANPAPNQ